MEAYASCYYAVTMKKSGWDCMRHYEIIAAGCIPYFLEIDDIPVGTMHTFPRALVKEAMHLPGVPDQHTLKRDIDEKRTPRLNMTLFDVKKYEALREKLLSHFQHQMLTKSIVPHLNLPKFCKIIALLSTASMIDYMHACLCISLLENGHIIHSTTSFDYLFEDATDDLTSRQHGKGFTISRSLPVSMKSQLVRPVKLSECHAVIYHTFSNADAPVPSKNERQLLRGIPVYVIDGNDIAGAHPSDKTVFDDLGAKHYRREL